METKVFSKFEVARMKRTAQNVNQFLTKRNKLQNQITEIQDEIDKLNELIEVTDAPTKVMTGGYGTEDIFNKVVTPTDKLTKTGKVITVTTYELKYPDTIIPPIADIPMEKCPNIEDNNNAVGSSEKSTNFDTTNTNENNLTDNL